MEYTESNILRHLSRFGITPISRTVNGYRHITKEIEVQKGTVGNGLLGKLDYLASKHGYLVYFK